MVICVNSCESGNKIRRVTYLGMEHEFKLFDRRQSSSEKRWSRGTGKGARNKVLQYFLRVIIVTTISTITNKMQVGRRMEQVVNLLKESGQICFREAFKNKNPKKFGNFPNFPDPPPYSLEISQILGFFQVSQKHLETNEYVLIHPELQKKYFQTKFCCCTVQFCTVRYCTVQGTTPPHKSEIFFFAFLDESGHFQCFPKGFRKNPKKSKKKFENFPNQGGGTLKMRGGLPCTVQYHTVQNCTVQQQNLV